MKRKGFTLVELLAVIVVLAILVTVATPNVLGILRKQKDNTTDIVVTNLKDAAIMMKLRLIYQVMFAK